MEVAAIILGALVAVGAVLYLFHRRDLARNPQGAASGETPGAPAVQARPDGCCGLHEVCEKAGAAVEAEYYDDEELDAYAGTAADAYGSEAVERFRDVLMTLLPEDVPGWSRSLELRGIALPAQLRDELLLLLGDLQGG